MAAWVVLIASGMMESVWAVALSRSEGFSQVAPTIVFVVALALSMFGLAYAVRTLPLSVSYAVWVGIGVVGTVVYGLASGTEPFSLAKVLLLAMLVGSIAGLKFVCE